MKIRKLKLSKFDLKVIIDALNAKRLKERSSGRDIKQRLFMNQSKLQMS